MTYYDPKKQASRVFWRKKAGGFYAVNGAYTAAGVLDPRPGMYEVYTCSGIGNCNPANQLETETYFSHFSAQSGIRYPSRQFEVTEVTCPPGISVLPGNYIEIYSANDATGYYIWFNQDSIFLDPAPPGLTGIEVVIGLPDTAEQVATALRSALQSNDDFTVDDKSRYTIDTADQKVVVIRTVDFGATTNTSAFLFLGTIDNVKQGEDGPEKSAQYRFGGELPEDPPAPLVERTTEDPSDGPSWEVVPDSIPPVYESGRIAGSLTWQGMISDKLRTISYDSHAEFADRHMGKPSLRTFHSHPAVDGRINLDAHQRKKEALPLDIGDPRTKIDEINGGNMRDYLDMAGSKGIIYENGHPVERTPNGSTNFWEGSDVSLAWSLSGACLREIDAGPDAGLWIYAMMYWWNFWDDTSQSWDKCGTLTCGVFGCPEFARPIYEPRLVLLRKRYRKDYAPGNPRRTNWENDGWSYGVEEVDGESNDNPWQRVGDLSLQHPNGSWRSSWYVPGTWRSGYGNTVYGNSGLSCEGFGGEANYNAKVGHFSPDGDQFVYLQQYQNQADYHTRSCNVTDPDPNVYQWEYDREFPDNNYFGNVFGRALVSCDITDSDSNALSGFIQNPRYIEERILWDQNLSSAFPTGAYTGPWTHAIGYIQHEHDNPDGGGLNGSGASATNGSLWVAADWDYDGNLVEIFLTKTWDWSDSDAPDEPYIEDYQVLSQSVAVNPDFECEDPPCPPPIPPEGCPSCGCKTLPLAKDHRTIEWNSGKSVTWHMHGLTAGPLVVRRELFYRKEEFFIDWTLTGDPCECCSTTDTATTKRVVKAGYSTIDRNPHFAGIMIHCLDPRSKSAVISQNVTSPLRFDVSGDFDIDFDGEADYKTEVIWKGAIVHTHTYSTSSGNSYSGNVFETPGVFEFPLREVSHLGEKHLVHDDKDSISLNWHFNHIGEAAGGGSPLPHTIIYTAVMEWERGALRLAPPLGEQTQWHWNDAGDFTFGYPHYWNLGNGQFRSRLTEQGVSGIFSCPGLPVLGRRSHYDFQFGTVPGSPPPTLGTGYGDDSISGGPQWLQGWFFGEDAGGDLEVDITDPLDLLSGDGDYGVWAQIVTV